MYVIMQNHEGDVDQKNMGRKKNNSGILIYSSRTAVFSLKLCMCL